jgi:AraC family transcriptional regulator of adaptative response / DNA-3-methyladenine glycosylase II
VSVAGARTLLGRLAATFGTPLADETVAGVTRVFPSARELAGRTPDELRVVGLTGARARTIVDLAAAVASGAIELAPGADVERTRQALEAIRGVGPWTSAYIAMRALGWPDAFPDNDLVVLRAMGETRAAAARARSEAWRPWRSYAVMHWWHA